MRIGRLLVPLMPLLAGCCLLAPIAQTRAQTRPATRPATHPTPEQLRARHEAHAHEFDYLLGDWEFTAESRQWGRSRGRWSAVRLDQGQILDEYRIVGDSGETIYVTTTLRAYNAAQDRWELVGMDAGGGLQDVGTAKQVGAEMHIEQTFGATTPTPARMRIRYYAIGPDRFSWIGDRSMDGGRTWVAGHLRIEARRRGPARSLGPLAPATGAPKD